MKNKFLKISLTVLTFLVFAVGGLYLAFDKGYLRMNYPSFEKYPVHGLDISHHQPKVDWEKLDRKYVQFIFIKATEGVTHKDSLFQQYWQEAKKRNIPVGAYHFYTFCTSGKAQARNFIESVPYDKTDLPPVIDLEYDGNCKFDNRMKDLLYEIGEYINTVEEYYGKKVIIYSTPELYKRYIANNFKDNPVWVRDIYFEPKLENNRKWLFWQYANKGRLDGIDVFVDINTFVGNRDDFDKLFFSND